jgi:nucleoporin NUP42
VVSDPKNHEPCYERPDPQNPSKIVLERIWFPHGPPNLPSKATATEAEDPSVYESPELGAVLKGIYEYAATHGRFKDGIMPEIPPKAEWISYNL